jgi:hypothetical protein
VLKHSKHGKNKSKGNISVTIAKSKYKNKHHYSNQKRITVRRNGSFKKYVGDKVQLSDRHNVNKRYEFYKHKN